MILRPAAKIATTEPTGPVFISLPGDILNDAGPIDLGQSTRVDTSARPSDATLRRLAERLLAAKAPVLLAGHEIVAADAFWQTARLAEALGAPVYQQTVAQGAHFPSEHPAYMGQLSRAQHRAGVARHSMAHSHGLFRRRAGEQRARDARAAAIAWVGRAER